MRVAVVGSGGFIGRHLVRTLTREGASVIAMSSQNSSGLDAESGRLPDGLRIDGVDSVVYLAQSPYHRRIPEMAGHVFRVNVISAVELAEFARQCGVRRFIYTSTGNVYRPAFHPLAEDDPVDADHWYTLSKLQGEQALGLFRRYMHVHVLRLFGVYGPGQSGRLIPTLLHAIATGHPIYVERNPVEPDDLDGLRISLGYVDDVVQGIVRICKSGGPDLLNVAGDEVMSVRSVAEAIGQALGVQAVIDVADRFRRGDLVADVTRFKEFHSAPSTPFAVGLRRTLEQRDAS